MSTPNNLVLYMYETCPYCVRVMSVVERLGLTIDVRDVRRDPEARRESIAIGGRTQVPMLSIDGRALYESADIIRFLEEQVAAQ